MISKTTTAVMLAIATAMFTVATPSAFAEVPQVQIPAIPEIEIPQVEIPDIDQPDFVPPPPFEVCASGDVPIWIHGQGWVCPAIEDFFPDFIE